METSAISFSLFTKLNQVFDEINKKTTQNNSKIQFLDQQFEVLDHNSFRNKQNWTLFEKEYTHHVPVIINFINQSQSQIKQLNEIIEKIKETVKIPEKQSNMQQEVSIASATTSAQQEQASNLKETSSAEESKQEVVKNEEQLNGNEPTELNNKDEPKETIEQ